MIRPATRSRLTRACSALGSTIVGKGLRLTEAKPALPSLLVICMLCLFAQPSFALQVYISKVRHHIAFELVQLKNVEPVPVLVGGWRIVGNDGEFVIPSGTEISSGGVVAFAFSPITDGINGHFELIDDLRALRGSVVLVDRVRFGCEGGAPAPPLQPGTAAIVRVPDPSLLPPQVPPDDETWWTVDLNTNFGNPFNVAPSPMLGSSLHINEVKVGYGGNPDSLELYNPTAAPVFLNGWFVTSAAGAEFVNGVVPPFGFIGLQLVLIDLELTQRLDLFDSGGVRVDQKSICGAPVSDCYGSCPDGAAATNGHDYLTCGGGFNWLLLPCSIGRTNTPCGTVDVPDPPIDEELRSWGAIKRAYRR